MWATELKADPRALTLRGHVIRSLVLPKRTPYARDRYQFDLGSKPANFLLFILFFFFFFLTIVIPTFFLWETWQRSTSLSGKILLSYFINLYIGRTVAWCHHRDKMKKIGQWIFGCRQFYGATPSAWSFIESWFFFPFMSYEISTN